MSTVTLTDVRKTYPNGHEAVKGCSLDIRDGEFVVLVGPSGCGKSTVLRMVAGLEEITGGSIAIAGRVVNDVEAKDRDIAMVFQNYALYPHMTVRKNMAFALRLRGVASAEVDRRVNDAARMLAIEELLDRKPGQLSGGQRQRVALGRAIVREPKVALFDEPLSNLDAKLRVATRAELKGLHQRLKTTSMYVTHDQEEAMTLGDRIVVMRDGVIQQVGTPLEVYQRPANRFVASFIGMPPMNFIEGRFESRPDSLYFVPEGEPTMGVPVGSENLGRMNIPPDGRITLGVRPQALHVATDSEPGGGPISWRLDVSVVEPLGELVDITCRVPWGVIVARVPLRESILEAKQVKAWPRIEQANWFSAEGWGNRLDAFSQIATSVAVQK
jgi:multiple sugar transport system ATP-binding protein